MAQAPNLLFIMTDQQRFDSLSAHGNQIISTPNIDALAQSGADVQEYFTNCPVCVPSRCTTFTGRYPHSHGIRENYNLLEPGREIHLFRVLKQNGYSLGYVGKNHCIETEELANFDYVARLDGDYSDEEKALLAEYREKTRRGKEQGQGEIWRAGLVYDGPLEASRAWQITEAAIPFIRQQNRPGPFALTVSIPDPHVPHLARKEVFDAIDVDRIPLPPFGGAEELASKARRWAIKNGAFRAENATDADKRRYIAIYLAMIAWVDTQVGRILQALEETGQRDNTLVVFTSDHGDFAFEHGHCKKDLVLVDSLLHVPLILSMPGVIRPQEVTSTMVEQVDLMPTILDLLGIKTPFGVQGTSIAPVLNGERATHKDAVFAEICPPYLFNKYPDLAAFREAYGGAIHAPFNVPGDFTKSIREPHWRYIWYGTGEEELYDHQNDPHELTNLANDPAYQAEKLRLKLRLLEWNALTEDPLDPNGRANLQREYPDWVPCTYKEGSHHAPDWTETRHMKLGKSPWPSLQTANHAGA